jgi:DNA-binding CsgD family transcriptional regulator
MPFWQRLLRFLRIYRPRRLKLDIDPVTSEELQLLARSEHRTEKELAVELLNMALVQRGAAEVYLRRWGELSPREQQVAALTCLGYTNIQIASRLVLSQETVKSHIRNVLYKFNLRSKDDLRHALADWDFSAWHHPDM